MTKRTWIGLGLLVLAILATVLFVLPWFADDDLEESIAPEFSSVAVIEEARVVLPPVAGGAAAIYFTITNQGEDTLFVRDVEFANGRGTQLADTGGVATTPLTNQAIHPGETVRVGPGTGHVVLTGYDSNVVPGAKSNMTLTFAQGQKVTVQATVEASPSQAERAAPGAGAQPPQPPGGT